MTMPNRSQTGMNWKAVRVQSLQGSQAVVVDAQGTTLKVRADYRTGGGPFPRVGEEWVIDRSLGFWTFSMLIKALPVEITGSNDAIPALVNLLQQLEEAGLIIDKTTPDRIRADVHTSHPHTH